MFWILANACTLGLDPTGGTPNEIVLNGTAMDAVDFDPDQNEAPSTDEETNDNDDGRNDVDPDDVDQDDEGDQDDDSTETEPDLDGDGYTFDDCDDSDPNVHPDQFDDCDTIDNDCDGDVDEDAIWDEDPSSPIIEMGEVFGGDVIEIEGLLFPEFDKDVYQFDVHDGLFGWFYIDALAESESLNTDIQLTLVQLDEETGTSYEFVFQVNDAGPGDSELLAFDGRPLIDDSGTYQLEITSMYGSDCEVPYDITLEIGT